MMTLNASAAETTRSSSTKAWSFAGPGVQATNPARRRSTHHVQVSRPLAGTDEPLTGCPRSAGRGRGSRCPRTGDRGRYSDILQCVHPYQCDRRTGLQPSPPQSSHSCSKRQSISSAGGAAKPVCRQAEQACQLRTVEPQPLQGRPWGAGSSGRSRSQCSASEPTLRTIINYPSPRVSVCHGSITRHRPGDRGRWFRGSRGCALWGTRPHGQVPLCAAQEV
jgi:hypothetical protein